MSPVLFAVFALVNNVFSKDVAGVDHSTLSFAWWFLGLLAIASAFLVPVLDGPWPTLYKQSLAATGLVFISLSVRPCRLGSFSFFLMAVCCLIFIQYMTGLIRFGDDAVLSVGYLLMLALAFEVGAQVGAGGKPAGRLFDLWVMFCFVALVSAGVALRQWVGVADSDFEFHLYRARPYANIGQPNLLGTLIFIGLCSLIFLQQGKRISGFTAALAGVLLSIGLAVTQSRTAWVCIGFAVVYSLWCIWRGNLKLHAISPLLWGTFFLAVVFLLEPISYWLGLPYVDLLDRVSAGGRKEIWMSLIDSVFKGPWHGYGWAQIGAAQLSVSVPTGYVGRLDYAHNIVLDLLIWMGPWLGMVVAWVSASWLFRRFIRQQGYQEAVGWLALSGMLIHAMLEFPHAYTYFLIPFGLVLGSITVRQELPQKECVRVWGSIWIVCSVVLLAGISIIFHDYRIISQNNFNEKLRRAKVVGYQEVDMSRILILQRLKAQQEILGLKLEPPWLDDDVQLLTKVAHRMPTLANLVRLGVIKAGQGEVNGVCATLKHIQILYGEDARIEALAYFNRTLPVHCEAASMGPSLPDIDIGA